MSIVIKKTANEKVQLSNSQLILQLDKFQTKDKSKTLMGLQITKVNYESTSTEPKDRFINIGHIVMTVEEFKDWIALALAEANKKV